LGLLVHFLQQAQRRALELLSLSPADLLNGGAATGLLDGAGGTVVEPFFVIMVLGSAVGVQAAVLTSLLVPHHSTLLLPYYSSLFLPE